MLAILLSTFLLQTAQAKSHLSRPVEDNLTAQFAQARKAQINKVDYDLSFSFSKGREDFSGKALLDLELSQLQKPLSIDFLWKNIKSVHVNGKEITDFNAQKTYLEIPAKYLTAKTQVEIEYVGNFSTEGEGIQRSVDPEDGAEYIFTDFEPYYAHSFFPCFDQPDLRATYKVQVDAPSDWKVIGNDLIAEAKTNQGRTQTRLAQSQSFSPYLFFLGVGPFTEWKDKAGEIPLFLYARKSIAKHVDAENIFATSKKGLKFFSEYFAMPYPFPKYGQIFIPEFAWGGMENPGAVALNERNIFRGAVSRAKLDQRDSLILHEMAHMWFGDLVTMKWWNDLWLNESFATYLAAIAQDRALGAKGAWQDFFFDKAWGYWQDQLVTTHPIETAVSDVRTAKGNFDGITYGKGASALKQLHFFVGEDGFREGLRSYFKKYAFKNTIRENFISEIAEASKHDLKAWTKEWLQTAGPNNAEIRWACDKGVIKNFSLIQNPSRSKTLSTHRTRLGFFKAHEKGSWTLEKTQEVTFSKRETAVKELLGVTCPDFIYANLDDQDYALYSLDPISLKVTPQAIAYGLSDPLTRLMIWDTLGQMLRNAQLSTKAYFDITLAALQEEKDESLLGNTLGRHSALRKFYFLYLTPEQRKALAPKMENILWRRVMTAEKGGGLQKTFFDFYIRTMQTPTAQSKLSGFLENKDLPQGISMDQDRRWEVIHALVSVGYEGATQLIENEEKKDISTLGKRNAYAAKTSLPIKAAKEKFWQELQKPDLIPFSTLKEASEKFNKANFVELSKPFIKPYFEQVAKIDWDKSDTLVEVYFEGLFPYNVCSKELLAESRTKMSQAKNLTSLAKRGWLEANDELARCVSIRTKSAKVSFQ